MNPAHPQPDASADLTRRMKLIFFVHALAGATFITRVADLQFNLGLSEAQLGLAFIGQPLGAIVVNLISSRLLERVGVKSVLVFGIILFSALQVLMTFAQDGLQLFGALVLFAGAFALTNVAINVEGDRVEAATGKRIMSSCHGIWAFGYLLATLVAVFARGNNISVHVHFFAVFVIATVGVLLLVQPMTASAPRAHHGSAQRKRLLSLPTPTILVLVLFGISGTLVEMSTRVWSVIFMRDTFSAPAWIDSLALTIFALLMAISRMLADWFLQRTGDVLGVRLLLFTAIIGLVLVATAPHYLVAMVGFALMGVGVCVSFPKMLSAAAQVGDRPASENVASTTLSNTTVLLVAPGLFGLVAEAISIRMAFIVLVPMLVVSILVARVIDQGPDSTSKV